LPTSFDYSKLLPDIAPQYLRDWAEARRWKNHALIWRVVWEREPITGIKHRCAEAFCTACGKKLLLDYVPGGTCNGSGYSPSLFIKCGIVHNWSYTFCPECGAEVRSEHVTGATGYAGEYCYPMTLHHVDMKEKSNRLAMIFWQVEKQHRKDGRRTISIMPWEAYIVEEKGIVRCTHHGSCMYSDYSLGFWRQTVKFTDTIKDIYWTVCPEGIAAATAGTTAENSKLELYMEDSRICFPVSWVRLWQKHKNAENLLTCGARGIVSNLIGQEKAESKRGYRESYGCAIPTLKCLNWKETRPGRMLAMERAELREAIAMQKRLNLGGQTWEIWLKARRAGHPWTLEDAAALETLERKDRFVDCPERPERIAHYLTVQRRRWKNDKPDESMLLDYWDMLRKHKPGVWTTEERWPERLKREHDRFVKKAKAEANRERDAKIAIRAKTLDEWEFHYGGLLIIPPRNTEDFTAEGSRLHHCVEGYSERHAAGKTTIMFIRKESAPDTPFFTLEWDDKRGCVLQNRGNRNCDRTPEVTAFEKKWVAWMLSGRPKFKEAKTA